MTSLPYHVGAVVISVLLAALVGAALGFPSPLGLVTALREVLPRGLQFYEPVLAQIAVTLTLVLSLAVFYR